MKEKQKKFDVDKHLRKIARLAKNAPTPEEILAQFARGDYSSLDPQFIKDNAKEHERRQKRKKLKKSKDLSL